MVGESACALETPAWAKKVVLMIINVSADETPAGAKRGVWAIVCDLLAKLDAKVCVIEA